MLLYTMYTRMCNIIGIFFVSVWFQFDIKFLLFAKLNVKYEIVMIGAVYIFVYRPFLYGCLCARMAR